MGLLRCPEGEFVGGFFFEMSWLDFKQGRKLPFLADPAVHRVTVNIPRRRLNWGYLATLEETNVHFQVD